jgi:hypothetical protein
MPASSRLQGTQLTFTNTSAATGGLSFNADAKFEFSKHVVAPKGLTSTGFVVDPGASIMVVSSFDALSVGAISGVDTLALDGSTSGTLTVQAAATTTSHTLTLPSAQGDVNTYLKNDGTGALSWVTIAAGGDASGDASGPASSTDNAVARFNLTTGKLLQNSGVTISDDNVVAGAKSFALDGSTSGTFTMQPPSTVSSYAVTMPATQGAKGSSLVNNGSGSLAWQLAGQGGLCWSSVAHGDPTVAPQSILGVFSGSAYWNASGGADNLVLTFNVSNQTGACNWNVPSFDFTRDFILRVGFKQDTGASGVQFGVGGSTPFASASTANGGLAFSYNTAPNHTNWTLNGSTVGKTVGFLDGVTYENAHLTSCLVVKTFLGKRMAILYHGEKSAIVNAFDCTAWQPGGQYVFVGARTAVSNAVHVCKHFSLEYIGWPGLFGYEE